MAVKFKISFKGEDLGVFDSDIAEMDELITLEAETGMTIDDLMKGLAKSSARAMQAIVWFRYLQLKRPQPLHVNFQVKDLDIEAVEEPADPTEAADPVADLEEAFKKPATSGSAR